jgi:DNA-binding IclR family transcriptional regulator
MEDLSIATRSAIRLGIMNRLQVSYIVKVAGRGPVSTFSPAATMPAHATAMGKALLAFAPPGLLDLVISQGLIAYTPHTLTTPNRLRRALDAVRLTGIAMSRWELRPGESAIAMPVFGTGGDVMAALEIAVHDFRGANLRHLKSVLTVATRSLSRELVIANQLGPDGTTVNCQRSRTA